MYITYNHYKLLVCLPGEITFSLLWNRKGKRKVMREERTVYIYGYVSSDHKMSVYVLFA